MTLTGQFEVPGNSDTGVEFTNPQTAELAYTFSTSGTWASDVSNPSLQACTAEGFSSLHPQIQEGIKAGWPDFGKYMKYTSSNPYGLVAENLKTGAVINVGKKATVVLKPGETLRFVLNDYSWDYGNNSGSISVNWSASNLVTKVISFDGSRDYITLPEMEIVCGEGFTVEVWVCFASFTKEFSRIIELDNFKNKPPYIVLTASQTKNDLYLGLQCVGGAHTRLIAPSVIEIGQWAQLAATVDTSGNAIIYKNGEFIASGPVELPSQLNCQKNAIGADLGGCSYGLREFHGKMAEVRIWNKARTQAEIQADMSNRLTGKEPNLVAYWPLDDVRVEGSALKVADLTGNYPGTVTGATSVEDSTFPVR
ncbi:MAG: LamG domain-containing protein [Oscillatoria princeps RMCB-10]|jgi:nucleoid DNA-binding protein|nr:LamG domain-containing protein [Oscillatoria princeps RMCB-10]